MGTINTGAVEVGRGEILVEVHVERVRQITEENFDIDHDNTVNSDGQLASAAACYALADKERVEIQTIWPWAWKWWKPADPRRNLIKAMALLLAEIERIDRKAGRIK